MKQILFLLLLIPFFSFSNKLEISTLTLNDDGNFITYSVAKGESLGDIAKKFSIKTATLLKYNNLLLNSSLKPNQSISIPLTETNYFRLNGITNSDSFLPIYYILESNIEKNILCTQLRILVESFDKWNKTEYADHLITGEKVLVGWLKIGTISQEESLPNKISRKEITNNNVKFEDHKMHPTYETPSKIVNSDNKIIDKKFNEPIQKREHEVVSSLNPKAIKKLNDRLSGSIKKIYQSIFTYNVDLKNAKKPIINSVKVKEIVVEEIFKESIDSNFTIKNEIKSSHLANSKNGKASLFYAGNKSGKIYIVTNLAPKGDIVKVTNTTNGHYIMAEVISSLPNTDISKGLLIKLSDNARLPLGVTDNVFIVKVNY
jgi:LysM repeat protein